METHFDRWKKTGMDDDLLTYATTLLNTPSNDLHHPVAPVLQQALIAAVEGGIEASDAASFLAELAKRHSSTSTTDIPSDIVDLIWIMDIESETIGQQRQEKLRALTIAIIEKNFIPVDIMKERWEIAFLEQVGLIPNSKWFTKRVVRVNTAQLYKQQKYNLLREESEGYSKLITELASGTADEDDDTITMDKAKTVLTHVQSLIGCFDLDPNRVLDIALDVFAANVVTHYRFFIHFLRMSQWNPKAKEHGTASRVKTCAQILGFKFQILQVRTEIQILDQVFHISVIASCKKQEHRHKNPVELYMVAALLIKHSLVMLEDLYAHLSLPDDAMEAEYKAFVADMKDKAMSFKGNALANAGALVDDAPIANTAAAAKDIPKAETSAESRVEDLPLPNQKVGITNALLAIGDVENALLILVNFPRLTASYPEMADLICRLIHVMIQGVYDPSSPSRRHPELIQDNGAASRYPVVPKGREITTVRILSPRLPLSTSTQRFEFFYTKWADDLVRCETVEDIIEFVSPLLAVIGVRIHRDTVLVTKLCRIGAGTLDQLRDAIKRTELKQTLLEQKDGEASTDGSALKALIARKDLIEAVWVDMARALFLPTISLIYSNPGMVNEVWQVLKNLRYETRFGLYGEWKSESPKMYPELLVATAETEKESKNVMRRINKEDVKQYGRKFAKLAHSNPLIVFAAAMKQLEGGYDNMVQPLVDACKYLTDFGYDVLGYALLESISKNTRSKVQEDGILPAKWMNTLASFCGNLYRKYPSAELDGILQYVVNQLRMEIPHDLVVLRELLSKMGGVEDPSNLNDTQLQAMAGGELLRNEALFGGVAGTVMKKNAKSCFRLQEAMLHDNIASHLLVLIAQHRQECIFGDEEIPHLKLLSNLTDQAHTMLLQLMDFLSVNLQKDYPRIVPSLTDMCSKYKIEPSVAMHILRPKLQDLVQREREQKEREQKLAAQEKASADINAPKQNAMEIDGQPTNAGESSTNANVSESAVQPWLKSLESIAEEAKDILPTRTWRGLSPQFYVTFWQLSLYDIFVPVDQYKAEITKLRQTVVNMDNDRAHYGPTAQAKRGRDRERLLIAAARLDMEMKNQLANHKHVMERLKRESRYWFEGLVANDRQEIASQTIQYCIYPRAVSSNLDALYCSKFIELMHNLGTANFPTLSLYDKLIMEIDRVIFLSSEHEAKTYGRFMNQVLSHLAQMHANKDTFEKAVVPHLPGFRKEWRETPKLLEYEDFRHLMYKWHTRLFRASGVFVGMLDSKEYMRIKNTIMILREIASCYPVLSIVGTKLNTAVQNLAAKEKRDDLKLMANAYLGVLKKQQDSDLWIAVALFHKPKATPATETGRSAPRDGPISPSNTSGSPTIAQPKVEATRPAQPTSTYRDNDDRGYPRTSTASSITKDRVNTVRDSRVSGTVSPGGGGRRNIPLPPKPAVPAYDSRSDQSQAALNRDTREASVREKDTRDPPVRERDPPVRERESIASTNQPRPDAVPELLVISLKSGPSAREPQENKDGTKDQARESTRDDGKDTAPRDSIKDSTRESNRDQARNSPRDVGRDYKDSNVQREAGRDRMRELTDGGDRDSRVDVKGSSTMLPPEARDRRGDVRDIAASRKELRDSAPRDPRDRDIRDGREARDGRPLPASTRDLRELRDGGDTREGRNGREPREGRDAREVRDGREMRDSRDARDPRDVREGRDARDARIPVAPKDPRDSPRDDARDGKDGRNGGGARPSISRQQSNEASRGQLSRMAAVQMEASSPADTSSEVDRQKERDRYRDDDKKAAAGRETDRSRDRDFAEDPDRSVMREGGRDPRRQGRDRGRDAAKDSIALESPSMAGGRDRQRGDGGGRDQERRGADRRDEATGINRTKVSPSRRGEDRGRDGRVSPNAENMRESHREVQDYGRDDTQDREEGRSTRGSTRQEPSGRDRDGRGTSRRHETGQEDSRKGGRESRSERRTDSNDRKRGRGSRNPSPEREKDPKRRRDESSTEETRGSTRSASSSRKRQIEPDVGRDGSPRDRAKDLPASSPLAESFSADALAMPPPSSRADGSPAVARPLSPMTSSSNARGAAVVTPTGSKRIKLNRPSDNDHPSDAHLQSSSSSSPNYSRNDHDGPSGSAGEIGLSTSSLRSRLNVGGSMTDHGISTSRGHEESRRDRRGESSRTRDHGMGTGSNRLSTSGGGRGNMSSSALPERSGGGGGGGGGGAGRQRRRK
ncbi:THO complex subunit 2 [Mortierella sp. 14UC]|nr:THO complex subunit 2 [Mortierella sp. 14UC]